MYTIPVHFPLSNIVIHTPPPRFILLCDAKHWDPPFSIDKVMVSPGLVEDQIRMSWEILYYCFANTHIPKASNLLLAIQHYITCYYFKHLFFHSFPHFNRKIYFSTKDTLEGMIYLCGELVSLHTFA